MNYEKEIVLLTSLGFEEYNPNNDNHYHSEIEVLEGEKLFIDGDRSRQRLYVKLSEGVYDDVWYDVYVLNNIGCGATRLPFSWGELSASWLTHLKMAFELHGFNENI